MKRIAILAVCFATLAMTSCGILNTSGNSAAQALGQTCGAAVLGLYQSYKSTGTLNLTNGNNLTHALALATCYTQLSQNKSNSSYRKAFANGLILSSAGLITNQNSAAFINALLGTSSLATVNNSSSSVQVSKTTPAITGLIKTLDK